MRATHAVEISTDHPADGDQLKGMLTGPVTILNWSFVRDDQPRSVSCDQLALAIREENMVAAAKTLRAGA